MANDLGLLGFEDPRTLGLLSLGMRLMSTPGKFGSALGQSGMGALQDMLQAQQQQRQTARQAEADKMMRDKFTLEQQLAQAKMAAMNAPAEPKDHVLTPGGALVRDGKIIAQVPFKPEEQKQSDLARLIAEMGSLPPGDPRRAMYTDAIRKMTTHAPPQQTKIDINNPGPVPASVVKQQDELIDRMTTARAIDADLSAIEGQIKTGALKFGPVRNVVNEGRNAVGMSDEESRNFGSFKSTLEKLRNDSLRLNNGVQTEGDAQRAWNELFQNINDTKFVESRLGQIRKINQRAAKLQQYRLQVLRENFNARPLADPAIEPALDAGGLTPAEQAELKALRAKLGQK